MVRVTTPYKAVCSRLDKRAASVETSIRISFHGVVFGLQICCFSLKRGTRWTDAFRIVLQPFADLCRRARVGHRPLEEYQNDKAQSGSDVSGDMRRVVFHSHIILPEHLEIR